MVFISKFHTTMWTLIFFYMRMGYHMSLEMGASFEIFRTEGARVYSWVIAVTLLNMSVKV